MAKCPTCNNPVEWKDNPFRPFCSERCQLVDLGKWVDGEYRVPGEELPPEAVEHPSRTSDSDNQA
jgi:uncharacterized protein